MQNETNKVLVGKITGIFGIKGWLKVYSYTRPAENILRYTSWLLRINGTATRYEVRDGRPQGKGLIVSLMGVDDREQAQTLTGAEILIDHNQLEGLSEGEFYWRDLLGMQVVDQDGTHLGEVTGILETGANDVLVIEGKTRELIPWVWGTYLMDVDLGTRMITVHWEGYAE